MARLKDARSAVYNDQHREGVSSIAVGTRVVDQFLGKPRVLPGYGLDESEVRQAEIVIGPDRVVERLCLLVSFFAEGADKIP